MTSHLLHFDVYIGINYRYFAIFSIFGFFDNYVE